MFDVFESLLASSQAMMVESQSNDALLTVMLNTFAHDVSSESILFHGKLTTSHSPSDAIFRKSSEDDASQIVEQQLDANAERLVACLAMLSADSIAEVCNDAISRGFIPIALDTLTEFLRMPLSLAARQSSGSSMLDAVRVDGL